MTFVTKICTLAVLVTVFSELCCGMRDLGIEVASYADASGQLSGKLFLTEYEVTVLCQLVNAAKGDIPGLLHETYGETFATIGHAPQLTLYNETWKVSFQFPTGSWDSINGYWKMVIAREELSITNEVHKQWLAYVTVGTGLGKLTTKTVVIDLYTDPLWNQRFGRYIGSSLDDIIKMGNIHNPLVAQHPCSPDTTLLILQVNTDVILVVSHDMLQQEYTAFYNVSSSLNCQQSSNTVCPDLVVIDLTVTTHTVILLTTRGLYVGQLLSVTARQNQQFVWVPVALPGEFDASVYKQLGLTYTSVCTSPKHYGDTQEKEAVILMEKGSSPPQTKPVVSISPYMNWAPIMAPSVTWARSIVYDYETDQYLSIQEEVTTGDIKIVKSSSRQESTLISAPFYVPSASQFVPEGLCIHPGSHHIYAYGSQIWQSIDGGNHFIQLLPQLSANETVTSCSTNIQQGTVVFPTSCGHIYYGKAGINQLAHIHPSKAGAPQGSILGPYHLLCDKISATYITMTGNVIQLIMDQENNTLDQQNVDVSSAHKISGSPFDRVVAVQILGKDRVVLFDLSSRDSSLTEASVGLQLIHRISGSMQIREVKHVPQQNGRLVTMVTCHVTQPLVWETKDRSPAIQHDINLLTTGKNMYWLIIDEPIDPSTCWFNSDMGKTITMPGASSILITAYHNHTHAVGLVVLPQLFSPVYHAGKWRLYDMRSIEDFAHVSDQILHVDNISALASIDTGSFVFQQYHQGYVLAISDITALISLVVNHSHVQVDFLHGSINGDFAPGGWSLYETKVQGMPGLKSSWSLVEPKCQHTLIPDDVASKYPVRFMDVGDSFTFSVTAAITQPGGSAARKPLLFMTISNPKLFHTNTQYTKDRFGAETLTVTLHHELFNRGSSSVTIHMPDASLSCPKTSFSLIIKCACPPSKHLAFVYDPPIPVREFLHGSPKDRKNKPLLLYLPYNYRPPSHLGIAVPLSDNIYRADPARKRQRDYYQDSKKSGGYKQCAGKASRDECMCSDDMKLSSLQRDTDCRERAYRLSHPGKVWPRFVIKEQDKEDQWLMEPYVLTLHEVNDRENYLVTDTLLASLTALKEGGFNLANGSQLYSSTGLKITLLGSELYHFHATVIEGFSYCTLEDEFQVYVDQPPLAYPTQMIIIASVSIGIGGAIFVIYLYYVSKHYIPPVHAVGSQCMDIHHQDD